MNVAGLRNSRIGTLGLRIPLPFPAQSGRNRQVGMQCPFVGRIKADVSNRPAVRRVSSGECLLIPAGTSGKKIGQRVVIETAVKIGLVLLSRRIVGELAADPQHMGAATDRQIVAYLPHSRRIVMRIKTVAAEHAEAVDYTLRSSRIRRKTSVVVRPLSE